MEKIESLNLQLTKINNHLEPKYDLTKRAGVMNYLNISNSTIGAVLLWNGPTLVNATELKYKDGTERSKD